MSRPSLRLALALVPLLALAMPARAAAQGVLPPGVEGEVARLVLPGADPADLGGGVVVDAVRIAPTHVDVVLAREAPIARVRLTSHGAAVDGERIGETRSFTLWIVEGAAEPAARAAAEALRARIDSRDDGSFFPAHAVHASSTSAPADERIAPLPERPLQAMRGALWGALVLGLAVLWSRRRRAGVRTERVDIAIVAALFVLALALRLLVPPWAPLHSNDHGITELRGLLGDPAGVDAVRYGTAYLQFCRVLLTLLAPLGRWPEGPFVLAALAGALAPPLLFVLARTLAGARRFGASVGAATLAVFPAHVVVSLSETPKALAGTLWLLGVALGAWALCAAHDRVARDLATVLTAIAWALALELHVLTMLLPWAGLALLVAAGRAASRPSWPALLAGVAIVGGVAAVHLAELRPVLAESPPVDRDALALVARAVSSESVLRDPSWAPVLLLPALALGAAALLRGGEARLVVGALASFAILLPLSMLVVACRTDVVRYQSEVFLPLLLLLLGMPSPVELETPLRRALGWALPAALLLSAVPGLAAAARPDVHAQAYALAISTAPPPPVPILVLPQRMSGARDVRADFPELALEAPGRVSTEPRPGCRAWVGVACWSFTPGELERGERGVELEDGPFRTECAERLGGVARAREVVPSLHALDVPHREGEMHRILAARPRVGHAPCPERD